MTPPLDEVWGVHEPDGCQLRTLVDYLDDRDLLALGLPDDLDAEADAGRVVDALSGRDMARIRILNFLTYHPEGSNLTHITSHCLKGVRPERVDIASEDDKDYRFASRFVNDLETRDFARVERSTSPHQVAPTTDCFDLISKGKREMQAHDTALVYDRDWARNLLATTNDLSEGQKHHLGKSLHRYVGRIDDYRLLFELTANDGFRSETNTWTKKYKTRFNDKGRTGRSWRRLQDALKFGFESASNAVLVTLTPDPDGNAAPDHEWRSILDIAADPVDGMNPAFHRLNQWLKSDPETAGNTRRKDVLGWAPERDPSKYHYFTGSPVPATNDADPSGPVTGRPRERLEYVKVLEWTDRGLPHLHILYFDVPERDKDGMPWLVDKNELSHRWKNYGMGYIVDTYPLTFCDDLDERGDFGEQVVRDDDGSAVRDDDGKLVKEPVSEGFVCWFKHGDHDHSPQWVADRTRYEPQNGDRIQMQSTAGAYLGKYLSAMYDEMFQECESLEERTMNGKASWWKLALYWATNRQIWSISEGIREHLDDGSLGREHVQRGVVDASSTTVEMAVERSAHWCDDLDDVARTRLHHLVEKSIVDQKDDDDDDDLASSDAIGVRVNHIGTYHLSELPAAGPGALGRDLDDTMTRIYHPDDPVKLMTADRPPPTADVWD